MKYILPLLYLLIVSNSYSQLTISPSIIKNDIVEWNLFFYDQFSFNEDRTKIFEKSYELGIGYLLRLKKKRIDINPTIGFSLGPKDSYAYTGTINELGEISSVDAFLQLGQLNISAPIRIFPFDFNSTNAVTVIRNDNKVSKQGLYFLLNPSFSLFNFNYSIEEFGERIDIATSIRFVETRIGIGAGFDIGITSRLTASPFLTWHKINNISNDYINQHFKDTCFDFCPGFEIIPDKETEFKQFQYGINLVFELIEY